MGQTSSACETSALDLPITEYHPLILYRVMSNWKKCKGFHYPQLYCGG